MAQIAHLLKPHAPHGTIPQSRPHDDAADIRREPPRHDSRIAQSSLHWTPVKLGIAAGSFTKPSIAAASRSWTR